MTDAATDVVSGFEQLREFCRQSALLLEAAKARLQKAGWTRAGTNSTVCDDVSVALDNPSKWIPSYFGHFFRSQTAPEYLMFVSVIFGYPDRPALVTQALVSAGWMRFDSVSPRNVGYWWARSHLWGPESRSDDGALCKQDLLRKWKQNERPRGLQKVVSFALPIGRVSNERELATHVLERILQGVTLERLAAPPIGTPTEVDPAQSAGNVDPGSAAVQREEQ